MLTYAIILTILALGAFIIWFEGKRATEGWVCEHCCELNEAGDVCCYCGNKKNSWEDIHG